MPEVNGTGIPPETWDKLFQPFFTTKPTGEGTGLGLSISWDIITQQHSGAIEVDSRVGEFSELTIRLPRARRAIIAAEAAERVSLSPQCPQAICRYRRPKEPGRPQEHEPGLVFL